MGGTAAVPLIPDPDEQARKLRTIPTLGTGDNGRPTIMRSPGEAPSDRPTLARAGNEAPVAEGAPAVAPAQQTLPRAASPRGQTAAIPPSAFGQPAQGPAATDYEAMRKKGSGISNIHNGFLRTLARIGDVGLGTFLPSAEMAIPGTEGNYGLKLARAGQQATEEGKRAHEAAQTAEQESLPEYHQQIEQNAADRAQAQRDIAETRAGAQRDVAATRAEGQKNVADTKAEGEKQTRKLRFAQAGFKEDESGNLVPVPYEEMTPEQQGVHDLKAAQTEVAEATAALKKAQAANQPALAQIAQARLQHGNDLINTAQRRLGLSEAQFELRSQGTVGGVQPAGGMQTETGQPVGTAFQQNVRPTGTQRDAAGRAETMLSLDARIRKALQNPELAKGTGPIAGRLSEVQNRLGTLPHDLAELKNDLVSYGAFQAGLHPVRGIGALEYFDKVMGGLGQNPEQLIGKLDSNKATAQSVQKVGLPRTAGSNPQPPNEPQAQEAQGGYKVGVKYGNLTYQGGDPNKRESWK